MSLPSLQRILNTHFFSILAILTSLILTQSVPINAATQVNRCAYAPLGGAKYKSSDTHFAYVNPNAPKGGKMTIGRVGTFDSLNFLRYPGTTIAGPGQIPFSVTDYLFDSFLVRAADEPAAWYCLAASKIKVSQDLQRVEFTINSKAHWHDGKPITADDVIFTFNTLKKQGAPYYRQVLGRLTIEKTGPNKVTYINKRKGDRNFPTLIGTLPLHPKHFWTMDRLEKRGMALPLGSGPYRISKAIPGKQAILERVDSYWAKDNFTQRGRFNFDKIKIEYYRDNNTALESFKSGALDIRQELDTVTWAQGYNGKALKAGKFVQASISANSPGSNTLLIFNERRKIFKDRRVRKALALLYNFENANRILFHGLYKKAGSLYGKSELAAKGKASDEELKILNPYLESLPKGITNQETPTFLPEDATSRQHIRLATKLLKEAGYKIKGETLIDPATGKPVQLSVSYLSPRHQRILMSYAKQLKTVGIELLLPALEGALARKKALDHDYDLALLSWGPDILAGTGESLLWGSRLADVKGSYAMAGTKDPALDAAITAMNSAKSWDQMTTATKVFDRIFNWQIYAIPLWHTNDHWISYWKKFGQPNPALLYDRSYIDLWWDKKL